MVTINTPEDLLRVLSENAEWKAAVRREILTEELLNLPARFDRFVEQQQGFNAEQQGFNAEQQGFNAEQQGFNAEQRRFNAEQLGFNAEQRRFNAEQLEFNAEQRRFNAEQLEFNEQQRQFNAEQREINARVDSFMTRTDRAIERLGRDISNMRADYARNNAVREAPGIALNMGFRLVSTLGYGDLLELALAGDTSDLTPGEVNSFRRADLVIAAVAADGATQYIAVEISYTADERDTNRALRNARLLTRFTGHPAHAAIASVRIVDEIRDVIASGQVHWHELDDRDPVAE